MAADDPSAVATPAAPAAGVLVLGIGNVLWADEGFGVRALEAFNQRFRVPAGVDLVDGGTQGLYLLDHVCSAGHVLVFDAIDFGLAPGTLQVYRDAEIPVWGDTKLSLHQATFQELLSLARLRDRFPQRIALVGVQSAVLDDLGGSLSDEVRAQVEPAVAAAAAELRSWGVDLQERGADEAVPALSPDALALPAYESGRPSAAQACRIGDKRVLAQRQEA